MISIALDKIEQNENSRVVYKNSDLSELMSSMRRDGLLQPVGLRQISNGRYDAVFGNRRIVAAKKLGWDQIDANVMEIDNDTDRDIINLLENMKRQNTSVAEDGRMFQTLKDRGLSTKEIAARLDVAETRITVALDVINTLPDDIQKKIHYRVPGTQTKPLADRVAATTAIAIMNARKSYGFNRAQTRAMFDYAAKETPTIIQINKIGPMVKAGTSIGDAIERVAQLRHVSVNVYLPEKVCAALEKKHNKTIPLILREILEADASLQIVPISEKERNKTSDFRLRKHRANA